MAQTVTNVNYVPAAWPAWERRKPEELGLDPVKISEAVQFSREHETDFGPDIPAVLQSDPINAHPHNEIVGPVKTRAANNGVILRNGYVVAEWGDTTRTDMTFSVAKSYLSTMAGIAFDRGVIRDLDDYVYTYVDDEGFQSERNRKITWRHLLQQSSEWEGVLFEKPDLADRRMGRDRELHEPGTFYEYNDVRVNRLALCLLRILKKPLPMVLRESIMDPIGASPTWEWHGYRNSWVTIDGLQMQSVSGGSHWGGGIWASSFDHARFGLLFLNNGNWNGQQLISSAWIKLMTTPSENNPNYGFMWWLNTNQTQLPHAPESDYFALGKGRNMIWINPENGLVGVVRWIAEDAADGFVERVLAAVRG